MPFEVDGSHQEYGLSRINCRRYWAKMEPFSELLLNIEPGHEAKQAA